MANNIYVTADWVGSGTTYLKDDIVLAGGNWVDSNNTFNNVVVDGNLVSTPAWPGLGGLMREFHFDLFTLLFLFNLID